MLEGLLAQQVMTKKVITIHKHAALDEAISLLVLNHISALPVVDDDDNMIGILSEKDILNYVLLGSVNEALVENVMTTQVVSFPPETPVVEIWTILADNNFKRIPIVRNKKVVGVVSRIDIVKMLL